MGLLKPGATFSFVLTLTLAIDPSPGTLLTNTFTVDTITPQSDESNDQDQVSTLVVTRVYLPLVMKKWSTTTYTGSP